MSENFFSKGWECPKCGAVMSPTTSVCVNCTGRYEIKPDTKININTINTENLADNRKDKYGYL